MVGDMRVAPQGGIQTQVSVPRYTAKDGKVGYINGDSETESKPEHFNLNVELELSFQSK